MSEKIFQEKIYHIYVNNKCIFHNLSRREFQSVWRMKEFLSEPYESNNFSYEELTVDKEIILRSSY